MQNSILVFTHEKQCAVGKRENVEGEEDSSSSSSTNAGEGF